MSAASLRAEQIQAHGRLCYQNRPLLPLAFLQQLLERTKRCRGFAIRMASGKQIPCLSSLRGDSGLCYPFLVLVHGNRKSLGILHKSWLLLNLLKLYASSSSQ